MKIKKAVIPAAGFGTRFLPATKTIPKEMLPIVDKPTILYNVEEILAADIHEVVLIAGREKTAIEDFFDTSYELEDILEKTGKRHLLNPIRELRKQLRVISIRQQEALGLGHAILCAQAVIEDEPFAVLLGDEIMVTPPGEVSAIGQLAQAYDEHQQSIVAVMEVPPEEVHKYGIAAVRELKKNLWKVEHLVEKPAVAQAPSNLALPGRYIFSSQIFSYLANTRPGQNGEIQLTDAMSELAARDGLLAMKVHAQRFDAGDKLGFMQANVELALTHTEVGEAFANYLRTKFGAEI